MINRHFVSLTEVVPKIILECVAYFSTLILGVLAHKHFLIGLSKYCEFYSRGPMLSECAYDSCPTFLMTISGVFLVPENLWRDVGWYRYEVNHFILLLPVYTIVRLVSFSLSYLQARTQRNLVILAFFPLVFEVILVEFFSLFVIISPKPQLPLTYYLYMPTTYAGLLLFLTLCSKRLIVNAYCHRLFLSCAYTFWAFYLFLMVC